MQMSRRSGFSMLELTVTIVIIGMMAAMALPKMDLARMRSDAVLRQISMICVQAQRTALAKQYNVLVAFDVANGRVRFVEDKNNSNTFDAGDRDTWTTLDPDVEFTSAPAALEGSTQPVTFARPRLLDGLPMVVFRRNGAASSDGVVFVTAKPSDPGATRGLTITQSTGRAEGFKWNGANWVRAGA